MATAFALVAYVAGVPAEEPKIPIPQEVEASEVAIRFSVMTGDKKAGRIVSGAPAIAQFRLLGAKNKGPLRARHPEAWIVRRAARASNANGACKSRVHSLHRGQLSDQAEVSLNSYRVLTLNQDNTISVLNPQISWSRTKLEALIALPGRGDDWLLGKHLDRLYVAMPGEGAVAVIDTGRWRLIHMLKLGESAKSARMAMQTDGRHIWVTLDDRPEVFAIETAREEIAARIPIDAGRHALAVSDDRPLLYISNAESDSVSMIDTNRLSKVADVRVKGTPIALAVGREGLVYVATPDISVISVIDPVQKRATVSLPAEDGISALRFSEDGRYGLALNRKRSTASLIDSQQQRIVHSSPVAGEPDQIVFSRHYAYIRSLTAPQYVVFDLAQIAHGELAPAMVEAGQKSPTTDPESIGHTDMVVPVPDGHGAILANGPDRKLYYYMEGMMAASGSLDNGGHEVRGVLMLDRSLRESVVPGVYAVAFDLPAPGDYEVPFVLDEPHLTHCFRLSVARGDEHSGTSASAVRVSPVTASVEVSVGQTADLRFQVAEQVSGQPVMGLRDVQVLVFEPPGRWQIRAWAKEKEPGIYAITQRLPRAGGYTAMVKIDSLKLDYGRNSALRINVRPPPVP